MPWWMMQINQNHCSVEYSVLYLIITSCLIEAHIVNHGNPLSGLFPFSRLVFIPCAGINIISMKERQFNNIICIVLCENKQYINAIVSINSTFLLCLKKLFLGIVKEM